ncbi:thymidylate synthase (FAD) [archaeon]|nr:thymidylate synthase (FAD) [archaeon]
MTRYLYKDRIGAIQLVQHMGDDITIVNSARVSFGVQKETLDNKDKKLISYLIKHRHTSTLEHNIATFRIKVPLFVRSQHHRHRTWSYNEISRRYTDARLQFYTPNDYRTQHKSNRQASNLEDMINPQMDVYAAECSNHMYCNEAIDYHVKQSLLLYEDMIKKGIAREQARMILPQNLYTEYYATANLNNLIKFIELRTHDGAQWEIKRLAEEMLNIITDLWPVVIQAYKLNKSV